MGQFYVTEDLSEHQSTTPEGFLLCRDVAIARTGSQLYACTEVPIDPTPSGIITVYRDAEEVFRRDTITSFEGKPVTMRHPDEKVDPSNWKDVAVGTIQNVRRGTSINDDYLFADLLITDAAGIEAVRSKKLSQVSCGYDAQYEQLEPGIGRQVNIVGNHLALVERGRAGPRCAIKDEDIIMAKPSKPARSWWDRLTEAVVKRDPKGVRQLMKDANPDDAEEDEEEDQDDTPGKTKTKDAAAMKILVATAVADALKPLTAALMAAGVKVKDEDGSIEEDPKDTKATGELTEAEKAEKFDGGEVMTGDTLRDLAAKAEILAPGIAIPTGDAITAKGTSGKLMRAAIAKAMQDADTSKAIAPMLVGYDPAKTTFDALRPVFLGAVELARAANNAKAPKPGQPRTNVGVRDFGRVVTPASINARLAERNKAMGLNS